MELSTSIYSPPSSSSSSRPGKIAVDHYSSKNDRRNLSRVHCPSPMANEQCRFDNKLHVLALNGKYRRVRGQTTYVRTIDTHFSTRSLQVIYGTSSTFMRDHLWRIHSQQNKCPFIIHDNIKSMHSHHHHRRIRSRSTARLETSQKCETKKWIRRCSPASSGDNKDQQFI